MRKKNRNPTSKESSGRREKAKGCLPDGVRVFFNKLGQSRSLWTGPWQQPAEKRQAVDHFGSESLWIPRAGRPERRREEEEEGSEQRRGVRANSQE